MYIKKKKTNNLHTCSLRIEWAERIQEQTEAWMDTPAIVQAKGDDTLTWVGSTGDVEK